LSVYENEGKHEKRNMLLPVGEKWFEIIVDPLIDDKGDFHGALHL